MTINKDDLKDAIKEALGELMTDPEFIDLITSSLKTAEMNQETSGTFLNAVRRLEELAKKLD